MRGNNEFHALCWRHTAVGVLVRTKGRLHIVPTICMLRSILHYKWWENFKKAPLKIWVRASCSHSLIHSFKVLDHMPEDQKMPRDSLKCSRLKSAAFGLGRWELCHFPPPTERPCTLRSTMHEPPLLSYLSLLRRSLTSSAGRTDLGDLGRTHSRTLVSHTQLSMICNRGPS